MRAIVVYHKLDPHPHLRSGVWMRNTIIC